MINSTNLLLTQQIYYWLNKFKINPANLWLTQQIYD